MVEENGESTPNMHKPLWAHMQPFRDDQVTKGVQFSPPGLAHWFKRRVQGPFSEVELGESRWLIPPTANGQNPAPPKALA